MPGTLEIVGTPPTAVAWDVVAESRDMLSRRTPDKDGLAVARNTRSRYCSCQLVLNMRWIPVGRSIGRSPSRKKFLFFWRKLENRIRSEESVTEVDLPGVVPSSARVSVSEETTTKDVDVCEESAIDVDVPVVVPSAALVSISEETTKKDVDVCEESEIEVDISVVADFHSLQNNPGKDAVPSEPIKSMTDTEPGVGMRSPEVGLEDHVIQVRVGSESGTNVGGLDGKAHDDTEHGGVKKYLSMARSVRVLGEMLMNRLQSCR